MNIQNIKMKSLSQIHLSQRVSGTPLNIDAGFQAQSFKHNQFDGLMDPLVMMDHYTMTKPTFGAHPHAGMSAVSVLFEDSEGVFKNQDSLGNDIDLHPGDAYWLKAGSGAVHDEKPTTGSRTHGLQLFVNLPQQHKHDTAQSLHVPAKHIPVITGDGYRVRVVFGESNGITGAIPPSLPFTILDAYLKKGGQYHHTVSGDQSVLVYAISGSIDFNLGQHTIELSEGQAIAMQTNFDSTLLSLSSASDAHIAVLQGAPIREHFVQKGPFVMSTTQEINAVTAAYDAGQLGSIPTVSSKASNKTHSST